MKKSGNGHDKKIISSTPVLSGGFSRLKNINVEKAVIERYAKGAKAREEALCCPLSYNPQYLKVIPKEILERDYGCGDPSPFVRPGDVVLDLGSGGGKICYIASQIVGAQGQVIGIDFNPTMLALARKYQKVVAERIGFSNVEFRWGKIQDLKTDLELLEHTLKKRAVSSIEDYFDLANKINTLQEAQPLVADESVDVIISNCVLNLVHPQEKKELFQEMYRVLKKGGRVAISDIVSDEIVPSHLQQDPKLWSGCISGAFQEKEFIKAFEETGFYGIKIEKFDTKPWRTVKGIEFRSVTITATKGKEGPCFERYQAVMYKGPWKQVEDDDKHILTRGVRTAVCDKTFQIFSKEPYKDDLIFLSSRREVPLSKAKAFDCSRLPSRHPKETKGMKYKLTTPQKSVCLDGGCC